MFIVRQLPTENTVFSLQSISFIVKSKKSHFTYCDVSLIFAAKLSSYLHLTH